MNIRFSSVCEHETCSRRANFGFLNEAKRFCGVHQLPNMTNLRSTYGVAMAMAERAAKLSCTGDADTSQQQLEEEDEGNPQEDGEEYEEEAAASSIPLPSLDDPIAITTHIQAPPVATDEFHYVDTLPIERAREFDF